MRETRLQFVALLAGRLHGRQRDGLRAPHNGSRNDGSDGARQVIEERLVGAVAQPLDAQQRPPDLAQRACRRADHREPDTQRQRGRCAGTHSQHAPRPSRHDDAPRRPRYRAPVLTRRPPLSRPSPRSALQREHGVARCVDRTRTTPARSPSSQLARPAGAPARQSHRRTAQRTDRSATGCTRRCPPARRLGRTPVRRALRPTRPAASQCRPR